MIHQKDSPIRDPIGRAFAIRRHREGCGIRGQGDGFASFGGRTLPHFHDAISSRGEGPSVGRKGDRLHEVPVGRGKLEARIPQAGGEFAELEVVEVHLLPARRGGETSIRGNRGGVDGLRPLQQGPRGGRGAGDGVALRSLVDPELQQGELVRFQVLGLRLVVRRRHHRILEMGRRHKDKGIGSLARHNRRTGVATLEHVLRRLEAESGLGFALVVASEAIGLEEGIHLGREVDLGVAFQFGDGQGLGTEQHGRGKEQAEEGALHQESFFGGAFTSTTIGRV